MSYKQVQAKLQQIVDARAEWQQALETKAGQEHADLQAQHEAAAAHWEQMLARRASDSKMFAFTIRGAEGPNLSGSVPRQIFDAEPTSSLCQTYNGEWEYTKDEQGRAVINSNPEHWPIILDWLSFGTLPSSPSPALVSECRFWQLERLLSAIGAAPANENLPVPVLHQFQVTPFASGFTVNGRINRSDPLIQAAFNIKNAEGAGAELLVFRAAGREWRLSLSFRGIYINLLEGEPMPERYLIFVFSQGPHALKKTFRLDVQPWHKGKGLGWTFGGTDICELMDDRLASEDGMMHITFGVQAHRSLV